MASAGAGAGAGAAAAAGASWPPSEPPLPSDAAAPTVTDSAEAVCAGSAAVPPVFYGDADVVEGGAKASPAALSFIRQEWIVEQMAAREAEYTDSHPVRVFVGSWNVNGKAPSEEVASWLAADKAAGPATTPDLYVIGFQEIVDLTATSVVISSQSNKRSEQWQRELLRVLNASSQSDPGNQYKVVDMKNLVGITIIVFAKAALTPHLSEIQSATAGVGMLGVMGNKGGAAVRFRLFDSTMCFVNSHLAAHRHNVTGRNSDFAAIVNKIQFQDAALRESAAAASRPSASAPSSHGSFGILDHDVVVWLGDLNYRVDASVSIEDALVRSKRFTDEDRDFLLARDQLCLERAAGRVFGGFVEAPIAFAPTYKYQTGFDHYDERPDKKTRAPAWCDRVLWLEASPMRCLFYGRAEQKCSDHKPIHALFEALVKSTVHDKRDDVMRDIMRQLDDMENQRRPRLEVANQNVNFGDVLYRQPETRTLHIKNVGEVSVSWRFVPKLEEQSFGKPWLTTSPPYGMLRPGEAKDVQLRVLMDDAVARDLSLGRETLNDVLVLRVERGRDFFVSISSTPVPTAYGASLAQLACRAEPMRLAKTWETNPPPPRAGSGTTPAATHVAPVPKEVYQLADWLFKHGLDHPGVFTTPAADTDVTHVRECVDSGTTIPPGTNPLAVADAFIQLLTSLREPVIPCSYFPGPDFSSVSLSAWCANLLSALSALHYNCLLYTLAFAREVLDHSAHNGVERDALVYVLSRCLLRKPPHVDAATHFRVDCRDGGSNGTAAASAARPLSVSPAKAAGRAAARLFADPGTRWEPSPGEQAQMCAIVEHLLDL